MKKKPKKGGNSRNNKDIAILLIALILITLVIFISKKPSISGFVVKTKDTTYTDNLNLVVNESKTVTWNLKNPGNIKSIKASGSITRNGSAKVYLKRGSEKILIFDSTKPLFDVNVEVLPNYKKIFQGEEVLIQIVLFNLKGFGSVDVKVTYSIKDSNDNIIATEQETLAVETQAKFIRKLLIPSDLEGGNYVAFVEAESDGILIGTSSDSFEVMAKYEETYPEQIQY